MKPNTAIVLLLSLTLAWSSSAADKETEEKVSLESIPAAAAKTLKEQAGNGKITSVSKETENGKTVYEGTFTKDSRVHDVTVDEAGSIISDEEKITIAEAPAAVQTAVEREVPGGKVLKVERITEGGKVNFEALVSGKDKREEIKFDERGKVIEREDKTGNKDKD
jgi:uncharacterized membrane protein YkoI